MLKTIKKEEFKKEKQLKFKEMKILKLIEFPVAL